MLEADVLAVEDVCQMLGLSRNTVYKLAKEGTLPSFRVGRKLRFSRGEVEAALTARSLASPSSGVAEKNPCDSPVTLEQAVERVRGPQGEPFALAGEDVALAHVARHLKTCGYEPATLYMNSYAALASLYTGQADAALVNLYDFKTNSYNVPFVQRLCPGTSLTIVRLFCRRQGLFVRAGNPRKITTWLALARDDVRLAVRERGSGLRVLLDQKMLGMEANLEEIEARAQVCNSAALALARVAQGSCDVCLGYREEAALVKGVQFVPQQMDAFDLVVRHTERTHKALRAVCQIASAAAFKDELSGMMECDTQQCGTVLYRC